VALTNTEILAQLRRRTRRIEPVTVPGLFEAGLVALTYQEQQDATIGAEAHFRKREVGIHTLLLDDWNAEVAVQRLARALVQPELNGKGEVVRVFKTADDCRQAFQAHEIAALLEAYQRHSDLTVRAEALTRLDEVAEALRQHHPEGRLRWALREEARAFYDKAAVDLTDEEVQHLLALRRADLQDEKDRERRRTEEADRAAGVEHYEARKG